MDNYLDQEIIAKLRLLKSVTAPADLRRQVLVQWVKQLSPVSHAAVFVWWHRLALAVLLLLISGSGIVLAAEKSTPGSPLYPVKLVVTGVKTKINASGAVFNKPAPLASPRDSIAVSSASPAAFSGDADVKGVVIETNPTSQPIASTKLRLGKSKEDPQATALPEFEVGSSEVEVQSIISITTPTATPGSEVRPTPGPPSGSPGPAIGVPPVQIDAGPVQIQFDQAKKGPPTIHIDL